MIFPIIKNIPPLYGSTPESGARKIGGYLTPDQLQASLDRIAAAAKPGA